MTEAFEVSPGRWTAGRVVGVAFVIIVAIGLLGLLGFGLTVAGKPSGSVAISRGPARSFSLPLFDGKKLSLSDLRGKPVFVNFWASWCVPCRDEAPVLDRAFRQFGDRIAFLGINVWDNDSDARRFMRDYNVVWPNGVDENGEIAIDYGVSGVPESYFIDRNGTLLRKWIGPLSDRQITTFLEEAAQ